MELMELVVRGTLLGMMYCLLAFPVSLLFVTTDSVDLAIGAYAVLAGAVSYALGGPVGIVAGVLAAVVASLVVGAISMRLNRPGRNDPLTVVLATFGFASFIESFVLTFFGKDPMVRQPFERFWQVGQIRISPQAGINVATGVALLGALYVLLYRTSYGRDMRASAANALGAGLAGVPVRTIWFFTYVAGGLLAGLAGVLILYTTGLSFGSGLGLTISGFGAAIIFGLQSPLRGFFGGLLIGIIQALCTGYLPGGLATAVPMLFILFVLATGRTNFLQGGRV